MKYSKEAIKSIKGMIEKKEWRKILIMYLSEADFLPPFSVFLRNLKDEEGKETIISLLTFKIKDPFIEEANLLSQYFFDKTKIERDLKIFLKEREKGLKKIKEKKCI